MNSLRLLLCATCAFVGMEEAGFAQAGAPTGAVVPQGRAADETAQGTGLGEIVVTAQRRTESLQDVPIAVSAFSGADLNQKQIQTTLDLPRLVPNMVGTNNVGLGSANTYFLRALGNTESIATFDPAVGTYVDDIYISRQNANNFAFFDVDRIEVLRGPQGTLFGRNATGGAINVILKKPAKQFGGYIEGSYGRFDSWQGRASIDMPLDDRLLTKVSAFTDNSDGFVNNSTTGEDTNIRRSWGVRGAVRAKPTDTVTWDISADYIRDNSLNLPATRDGDDYTSQTGLSRRSANLRPYVFGKKGDFPLQNITRSFAVTSNLQVELGGASLSLISGYRRLNQGYSLDIFDGPFPTGSFGLANRGFFKQYSQEAKLNGSLFGGKIDYVAGLFYLYEDNKTDFADVFTVPVPPAGLPLVLSDRIVGNTTSAPAAYAQFDWHATDAITLTLGGRYTAETKKINVRPNPNPAYATPFDTDDVRALGIPVRRTTKVFTPRIAAEYRFGPELMVFASATRGFRSGGWNARSLNAEGFNEFGPEKVWSYETGVRSELFDRRARLNVTGFYTDVSGFQVPVVFLGALGNPVSSTQNGSDLRVYGLEAELTVAPARGVSLFGNVGLLNADYRNPRPDIVAQQQQCRAGVAASCGQGIVAPDGSLAEPQRAPHVTASFGGSWEVPLGDTLTLTPAANASYESRKTVGTAGTPLDYIPRQWLVGASLALAPRAGPWRLSVECSNCFDKATVGSYFPPSFFFWNPPRIWRARVSFNF